MLRGQAAVPFVAQTLEVSLLPTRDTVSHSVSSLLQTCPCGNCSCINHVGSVESHEPNTFSKAADTDCLDDDSRQCLVAESTPGASSRPAVVGFDHRGKDDTSPAVFA